MEKFVAISKKVLERRFLRYLLVGGSTFAIDFSVLVILHGFLGVNVLIAATISFWTSILFNFVVNRSWTFGSLETNVGKNVFYYLALLGVNYLFVIGFIALATNLGIHYTIAKIIATAMQTLWTYLAYQRVVFK